MYERFSSTGYLKYSNNPYKLIVEVDDQLGSYYRSLIPKYISIQRPMYPSHISVVRNEIPKNVDCWGKYDGCLIYFEYEPGVKSGEIYHWLNVISPSLEDIRAELGLSNHSEYTKPPDGSKYFHITVANSKHVRFNNG